MTAREELAATLRGEVIGVGDPGYDEARAVYNAMIDKRPALIARCVDVADVIAAVEFGRSHDLALAIRSGGHNAAGLGIVDDGLVVDLARMRGIRVDPEGGTVRVQGGCTWGDVDHATHAFGRAVPSGVISTTGVGGLTLGGGLGHLTRKFGLTIDNLVGVDIVLADGTHLAVDADHEPDLFWALRGGGGNFGIITEFRYRLNPVHTIVGGPTLWPIERSAEVMAWYREFLPNAGEDLNGFFAFLVVPPAPPFPEELHLQKMCGVVWCYVGPADQAEAVFAPVRETNPALYGIQEMPFPALQSAFDGLYPPGYQWYWRADFVDELPDEAIAAHVRHGEALPTMLSSMHMYPIDGAVHQVADDATAWAYRNSQWAQVIVGVDPDPAKAADLRRWTVEYWEATHPYSAGGAYVNFMMEEGQERVQATYRHNFARLAAIKARYDPGNVFSVNQNIAPAA